MPTGTVLWFSLTRGFGFIQPDDRSKDVFVHIDEVRHSGFVRLNEGQKLQYEVEPGGNKPGRMVAVNIQAC